MYGSTSLAQVAKWSLLGDIWSKVLLLLQFKALHFASISIYPSKNCSIYFKKYVHKQQIKLVIYC